MTKSIAAARKPGPSRVQRVFASGSTAVLVAILASAAATVNLYLR